LLRLDNTCCPPVFDHTSWISARARHPRGRRARPPHGASIQLLQKGQVAMRFMIQFSIPTQYGNEIVRSGKIEKVIKKLGEEFKPEAMYFYPADGLRSGCMFIQSDNPAICAAVGERMWFGLQAQITVTPVMNGEDLGKGLAEMGRVLENYA
jgi:hypothetical protein